MKTYKYLILLLYLGLFALASCDVSSSNEEVVDFSTQIYPGTLSAAAINFAKDSISEDAQLLAVFAHGLNSDGQVELGKLDSWITYWFRSDTLGREFGVRPRSIYDMTIDSSSLIIMRNNLNSDTAKMIIDTLFKRMRSFPLDTLSKTGDPKSILRHIEDSVDVDGSIMTGATKSLYLFNREVIFPRAYYGKVSIVYLGHEIQELQQYDYLATRFITSPVAATNFQLTLNLLDRHYQPPK
ncbi:MAG: hypothetical protein GF419_12515 [Ignavibacteriales bacterium]|nr:hypothetical protein [Ignavibacteriales bacterium]